MTRVSRSRRCAGVSGTASSRMLAHVERLRQRRFGVRHRPAERRGVALAELLDGQSQFVARWCARRCRRRRRSTWTARRARRGRPRPAPSGRSGRPAGRRRTRLRGACARAGAPQQQHSTTASAMTAERDEHRHPETPPPELGDSSSPLAAATAAPAQSPWRSAGSISLRRRLSTCCELSSVTLSRH